MLFILFISASLEAVDRLKPENGADPPIDHVDPLPRKRFDPALEDQKAIHLRERSLRERDRDVQRRIDALQLKRREGGDVSETEEKKLLEERDEIAKEFQEVREEHLRLREEHNKARFDSRKDLEFLRPDRGIELPPINRDKPIGNDQPLSKDDRLVRPPNRRDLEEKEKFRKLAENATKWKPKQRNTSKAKVWIIIGGIGVTGIFAVVFLFGKQLVGRLGEGKNRLPSAFEPLRSP
jgi:hypothetical protein